MVSSFGEFSRNGSPRGGEPYCLFEKSDEASLRVINQRISLRIRLLALDMCLYRFPFLVMSARSDRGVSPVILCNL